MEIHVCALFKNKYAYKSKLMIGKMRGTEKKRELKIAGQKIRRHIMTPYRINYDALRSMALPAC